MGLRVPASALASVPYSVPPMASAMEPDWDPGLARVTEQTREPCSVQQWALASALGSVPYLDPLLVTAMEQDWDSDLVHSTVQTTEPCLAQQKEPA